MCLYANCLSIQEMQMIKMSKTTGLTKLQQRGNRSSLTSSPHPLPASPSSSSSSTTAAVDASIAADSLNIVESRVCRELMVDKFNRVSKPWQKHSTVFLSYTIILPHETCVGPGAVINSVHL